MKLLKLTFIAICLITIQQGIYAQQLSQQEKNELQLRVKQKIEDFQMYLGIIASKSVSPTNKDNATANALALFVGKGDKYYYYEYDSNGKQGPKKLHDPVKMQTSTKRGGNKPPQPMKDYLAHIRNMTRYTKVVIESADAVRVDELYEVSPGRYEGMAYFSQKYCGYQDGRLIYSDVTVKRVRISVDYKEIPDPTGTKHVWKVLLGDISVVSTH